MNGSKKNWYLDHRTDDLRGWPVLDANGSLIGEVTELLVDTDSGYVTTVVLLGGRKLPAHDMQIGENVLTMLVTTAEPVRAAERAAPRPQLASVPPEKETVKEKAKQKLEELEQKVKGTLGRAEQKLEERRDERREDTAERRLERAEKHLEQTEDKIERTMERAEREKIKAKDRVQRDEQKVVEALDREGRRDEKRLSDDLFVVLVDEELEVGTRAFEAGGVHLEAHTISEPITHEVRLHEERVTISRNKVDRMLDVKDANRLFHDETYEMTATAEVPVVSKYAHVVEEIVLKKNAFTRDETVHETLRHMEADITELRQDEALQGARR